MSFLTQRFGNRYPLWTKVRRDPSSFGQRWFSTFAEYTEANAVSTVRMKDELRVLKWQLGAGAIWMLDLDETDQVVNGSGPGGGRIPVWDLIVDGVVGASNYTLERVESLEELLNAPPVRVEAVDTVAATSYLVWSSSDVATYVAIPTPERLTLVVKDSTEYLRRTRRKHRMFSGFHGVILRGLDENDISIQEIVEVDDDGIFTTRNIWKELTSVQYEGFDGTLDVYWSTAGQAFHNDIYRTAVLEDLEGPLKLSLRDIDFNGSTYSLLVFETERLKLGHEYRDGATTGITNTELVSETILLDSTGASYVAVDLAINHRNTRLYVLGDDGRVHTYEHGPGAFGPGSEYLEPQDTHIRIEPLQHYVALGQTEKVFTKHYRPRYPISSVVVKRISPSAVTEYLQADKTWSTTLAQLSYRPTAETAEESWQDLTFETEYDELGQWEYYLTVQSQSGTEVSYTAVLVDSLVADTTVATGVAAPTDFSFSKEEYWQIGDGTTVSRFSEHCDVYLGDAVRQRLVLREEYDSVTVSR